MIQYGILQIVRGEKVSPHAKLNCNSLENIHGWTVILHGQSLSCTGYFTGKVSRLTTNLSAKTAKIFHLKRFAIYSIINAIEHKVVT